MVDLSELGKPVTYWKGSPKQGKAIEGWLITDEKTLARRGKPAGHVHRSDRC